MTLHHFTLRGEWPPLEDGYSAIPDELMDDRRLRPPAFRTAVAMISFANENGIFPFDPDFLATRVRLSPDQVRAALKRLIATGWITVTEDAGRVVYGINFSAVNA